MKLFNLMILLMIAGLMAASGCTTKKGIQVTFPEYEQTIATLQPTLQWQAVPGSGVTYDLVMYEEEQENPLLSKEGLTEASFKVESELKPGTLYRWTVRSRKGDVISEWTKQETTVFVGVAFSKQRRIMRFFTPAGK